MIYLVATLWVNFTCYHFLSKNYWIYKTYLSYQSICMTVFFLLLVFTIGGLTTFNVQLLFSLNYFYTLVPPDTFGSFPLNCLFCILIFLPILYKILGSNEIAKRILTSLETLREDPGVLEQAKNRVKRRNYKTNDPYY